METTMAEDYDILVPEDFELGYLAFLNTSTYEPILSLDKSNPDEVIFTTQYGKYATDSATYIHRLDKDGNVIADISYVSDVYYYIDDSLS